MVSKYNVGDKVRTINYMATIMTIASRFRNVYAMEEDNGMWCWRDEGRVEHKKYYLRDTLIDGNENYLNYGMLTETFKLACSIQSNLVQTKFTDQEIEDLGIPIERFEKIPVNEEE